MPGEYRGCLGCHASHRRTPETRAEAAALKSDPRDITPPPWPDHTVSYPRYVQPVLDRYCGQCHQGEGEGRKVLDLTERPSAPVFQGVDWLAVRPRIATAPTIARPGPLTD